MMKKTSVIVGIIPARGGSKGIPKKNIKQLNGKPLVVYTIESALASGVINKLIVSTDDDEIAQVCNSYKDVLVYKRPLELATDTASTEGALIHACDKLISLENIQADYVLTLEPTSPFRSEQTIQRAVELLLKPNVDSVVGVTEVTSVLGRIDGDVFSHIFPNQPRRRQDRKPLYQESSTIYGTSIQVLRNKKLVIGDFPAPLIVPKEEALDINDEFDFQLVELVMKFKAKIK
jgi:CMP-N,N'-diacetyllegionaminic acid synthase